MKRVKKILLLPAAVLLLSGMLTGCGKPDPNSGVYEGTTATMMGMTMNVSEVYGDGVTFDLKDGGKCVCNLDGETVKLKWSTDGDKIHFEGGGVELDGTIGGGDLVIENMMDSGMDLYLHCDNLLHSDLEGEGKDSAKDKKSDKESSSGKSASGSVLERLKDAKNGKNVYSATSSGNEDGNSGSDEAPVIEYGEEESGDLLTDDGAIGGDTFVNPDYEKVSGEKYSGEEITVSVPDGWKAFEASDGTVRVIKGGSSMDDYLSNASVVAEWHEDATGKIDTSNMEEPVSISHFKLGDHDYNGAYGTVPGDWTSYMFIDEYEDGYLLVTLSLPSGSDVYLLDADVQAIMASVEV